MWRSLFYAVGIGLFATGLQTLVVEHVTIPKDTKFQKRMRRFFEDDKPAAAKTKPVQPQLPAGGSNQVASNWPRPFQAPQRAVGTNQSYGVNTGSRFGPSRFSGPAYGTGYGGARVGTGSSGRAPQGNTPLFGGSSPYPTQNRVNAQLAGYNASGPVTPAKKPELKLQKVMIREWMPWSLLASGAIIFLYTHTHHRRRHED